MHFDAKKTTARNIPFDQDAYDAVVDYQKSTKAHDDAVMFAPASGNVPTRNHARWIQRFFEKHGEDIQSHDFRATRATKYYKATNDIVATQKFVGHSSVETTMKYLKIAENEMIEKQKEYLMQ